jgi:CDP-diacylglycerol pyrophosphatase
MMKSPGVALALALGCALGMAAALAGGLALPGIAWRPLPGPTWAVVPQHGVLWNVVQQCVRQASSADGSGSGSGSSSSSGSGSGGAQPSLASSGISQPDKDVSRPNACARVDMQAGYVVLKDNSPVKPYAFLLLPTDRVTGIEDSRLWVINGTNYWRAAYDNRHYVEQVLKMPLRPTQIGFAANSIYGRSQDQLHIHMTCIRPDVAATLAENVGKLSDKHWTRLPPMAGRTHVYRALLTDDADLARTDPVRLLASDIYPDGSMLAHTLFMAAVTLPDGRPGFAFLDSEADESVRHGQGTIGSNRASSEELLDDTCAIAKTGGAAQSAQVTP